MPDVYQATANLTLLGTACSVGLVAEVDTPAGAGPSADDFANAIGNSFWAPLKAFLSARLQMLNVSANRIAPTKTIPQVTYFTNQFGTVDEDSLPANLCLNVLVKTGIDLPGHPYHYYVPGAPESVVIDGEFSPTWVSAVQAVLDTMVSGLLTSATGTTYALGKILRQSGGVPVTPEFNRVIQLLCNPVVSTLRRRKNERTTLSS